MGLGLNALATRQFQLLSLQLERTYQTQPDAMPRLLRVAGQRAGNDMSQKILQVNMNFSVSRAELEAAWLGVAQPIADTPGLRWKIWLMNEARHEAGGIYFFESEAAANAYLAGPIVAALKASPAVSNISAKLFDALDAHTAITRGPVT